MYRFLSKSENWKNYYLSHFDHYLMLRHMPDFDHMGHIIWARWLMLACFLQ